MIVQLPNTVTMLLNPRLPGLLSISTETLSADISQFSLPVSLWDCGFGEEENKADWGRSIYKQHVPAYSNTRLSYWVELSGVVRLCTGRPSDWWVGCLVRRWLGYSTNKWSGLFQVDLFRMRFLLLWCSCHSDDTVVIVIIQ